MIMRVICAHNYENTDTKNMDLYVNSCGHNIKLDRGSDANRISGREDFQIICVTEGKLYSERDGKTNVHLPGEILIYYPGEPQRYYCKAEDNSSFYWVHFDGKSAVKMMKHCGIYGKKLLYSPLNKSDIKMIYRIVEELNRKLLGYNIEAAAILTRLCLDIGRRTSDAVKNVHGYHQLGNAIRAMELDSEEKHTIDDYARMCGISRYHFIHTFKAVTGKTPIQYRNEMRITRSAALLVHTDMSIKSISADAGFEDPLYFSRCFCRHYGISPSEYRKKNAE